MNLLRIRKHARSDEKQLRSWRAHLSTDVHRNYMEASHEQSHCGPRRALRGDYGRAPGSGVRLLLGALSETPLILYLARLDVNRDADGGNDVPDVPLQMITKLMRIVDTFVPTNDEMKVDVPGATGFSASKSVKTHKLSLMF